MDSYRESHIAGNKYESYGLELDITEIYKGISGISVLRDFFKDDLYHIVVREPYEFYSNRSIILKLNNEVTEANFKLNFL